ncbi:hypothetical protein DFH09DRAFT_1076002 [Mycena vulgaris]|nr:hypothetical protein DFH09DRAFT_1076002 [Mycena vulgaris]
MPPRATQAAAPLSRSSISPAIPENGDAKAVFGLHCTARRTTGSKLSRVKVASLAWSLVLFNPLRRGTWWASLQVFPSRRVRRFKLSVASTQAPASQFGSCISLTHSLGFDATSTHEFLVRRRSLGYSKNGASKSGWRLLRWFFRWAVVLAILMEVSCDPLLSHFPGSCALASENFAIRPASIYFWLHRLLASIEPP